MPFIRNWTVNFAITTCMSVYGDFERVLVNFVQYAGLGDSLPVAGAYSLVGEVEGHESIADGERITTNVLDTITCIAAYPHYRLLRARTKSGSMYDFASYGMDQAFQAKHRV